MESFLKPAAPFTPAQIAKSFQNICGDVFMEQDHGGPFMAEIVYQRTPEQVNVLIIYVQNANTMLYQL